MHQSYTWAMSYVDQTVLTRVLQSMPIVKLCLGMGGLLAIICWCDVY